MHNSKIIEMRHEKATEYCRQACADVASLPNNSSHQALVELSEYVIKRRK